MVSNSVVPHLIFLYQQMYLKVANFKSWVTTQKPSKYLPKHHKELDVYDNAPPEFHEMLPIRQCVNYLTNDLDDLERLACQLKHKEISVSDCKQKLRPLRSKITKVLKALPLFIKAYCVIFFAARFHSGSCLAYWQMGKPMKAVREIRKVLDWVSEGPHSSISHTALLLVSEFPKMLVEMKEWELLKRLVSWTKRFEEDLPIAKVLVYAASSLLPQEICT